MKKFCFFIMFFVLVFSLTACSSKKQVINNISEKDECLFYGEDENFFVTLCIGRRENPYIVDGKNSELIDFAVLTANRKNVNIHSDKVQYKINVNGKNLSGTFEVNPFDGSFVVDLLDVGENLENINVDIIADSKTYNYNLINALDANAISADDALSLASQEFKKCENQLTKNGTVKFEIYVRLMKNPGQIPLFYISAINEEDELFALIVDPITKQVIAKNFK